jgi:dihydrofolate reductase
MKVILISAQSADGFITRHEEPGSGFTSAADREYFGRALAGFDSSIMGSATYLAARDTILANLSPGRRRIVLTRNPEKYESDAAPGILEFTRDEPKALVGRLKAEGHRSCALLGGARIHSLFFAAGLVDEIWLTMEPRLFGAGTPFLRSATDIRLRLLSHERMGGSDTLLLKFAPR